MKFFKTLAITLPFVVTGGSDDIAINHVPIQQALPAIFTCICEAMVGTRGAQSADDNVCAKEHCQRQWNVCRQPAQLGGLEDCVVTAHPECYLRFPPLFGDRARMAAYFNAIGECYQKLTLNDTDTTTTESVEVSVDSLFVQL